MKIIRTNIIEYVVCFQCDKEIKATEKYVEFTRSDLQFCLKCGSKYEAKTLFKFK